MSSSPILLLTHYSSQIDALANVDPRTREGIWRFIAGDENRLEPDIPLDITDAGVKKLCQALPNLRVIHLLSTRSLSSGALPEILLTCDNIESVVITAALRVGGKAIIDEPFGIIEKLHDLEWRQSLRYLEFRGFRYKRMPLLMTLTRIRPELEIIFKWQGNEEIIRDGEFFTTYNEGRGLEIEEDEEDFEDGELH